MKYILEGNDKELERVIRENRIRVNRGLISITPISECGLITEEDARKALEDQLATKDTEIGELTASIVEKDEKATTFAAFIEEKDKAIVMLTEERDSMKSRIAELEVSAADNKNLPADDSKELTTGDLKDLAVVATDNKNLPPEDKKETGKKASK